MITVPADVFEAMHRETIRKRLRVTWSMGDGTSLDVTDRAEVGTITRTLRPLLGGYSAPAFSLRLSNHDKMFSEYSSASILYNRDRSDYLGSTITIEQAVWGDTTGWHYLPVITGIVTKIATSGRRVELRCVGGLARYLRKGLAEAITLDPNLTASEHVESILTTYTPLTAGDMDTASFTFAENVQYDIQWTIYGQIPAGTPILKAAEDVAQSGFGQIYDGEDGTIYYSTQFPRDAGDNHIARSDYPHTIDVTNAANFTTAVDEEQVASRIRVDYQNVMATYIDTALETDLGMTVAKTVRMPYLLFYRCARIAAYMVSVALGGFVDVISFTTHGIGLLLQLDDRVSVKAPDFDSSVTYRVTSKRWSQKWVEIEAVREWHLSSILDGSFASRGVTNWGDSSYPML